MNKFKLILLSSLLSFNLLGDTNAVRVAWQYYSEQNPSMLRLDFPCTGTNTYGIYPNDYDNVIMGKIYNLESSNDFTNWNLSISWTNRTVSNYHGIFLIEVNKKAPQRFYRIVVID